MPSISTVQTSYFGGFQQPVSIGTAPPLSSFAGRKFVFQRFAKDMELSLVTSQLHAHVEITNPINSRKHKIDVLSYRQESGQVVRDDWREVEPI